MTLESTVLTRPGTLIIAPPIGEAQQQASVKRPNQEERQEQGQQSQQRPAQAELLLLRGNSETFADADKFREQRSVASGSGYQGQSAVNAYQSLAFESRRDEIKQMMGVDTYA